jgi:hypothetical protein
MTPSLFVSALSKAVSFFSEWFVIDDAKIRTVYTAMFYPPPELAGPNWPPYDSGNWPLPAAVVPAPAP